MIGRALQESAIELKISQAGSRMFRETFDESCMGHRGR